MQQFRLVSTDFDEVSLHTCRRKDLQSCHPERSRRRSEGSGANKRLEATDSSLTLRMTERTLRMTGIRVACALVRKKPRCALTKCLPEQLPHFQLRTVRKHFQYVCLGSIPKASQIYEFILRVTSLTLLRNVFVNFLEPD